LFEDHIYKNTATLVLSIKHISGPKGMKRLNPYLIFNGNCKEAMIFYQECLKGEIESIQTFRDSPINFPEDCKHLIFDSELRAENIIIKASDSLLDNPMVIGRNISLFIVFQIEKSQKMSIESC
jgi:PhnB protein